MPREPLRDHPPPTIEMVLAASEEMLPVWNADPHRETKRLEAKCHERFVLRE